MKSLQIYEVNPYYVKFISTYQEHIYFDEGGNNSRKYVGIVLEINGYKYFAPLSSFKKKHRKMRERVDLIKIKDIAVINLNNMIPFPEGDFKLVEINRIKDKNYRYLLQSENIEINKQKERIRKNANTVYKHKCVNNNGTSLSKRTNDFKKLEQLYKEYIG